MNESRELRFSELQKRKRTKFLKTIGVLLFLILVAFFISMNLGASGMSVSEVVSTFFGNGTANEKLILFQFRLPRMVIALLIGIGLSISGTIIQGITDNPLADPSILGINYGAGLFAAVYLMFLQNTIAGSTPIFIMPIIAFAGGIITAFVIYGLSYVHGKTSPTRMVLIGIGVGMFLNALLLALQTIMDPNQFMDITFWLSGSLANTNWHYVFALLPWVLILAPLAYSRAGILNVLGIGTEFSKGLGVNIERQRFILWIIAVGLASSCTAVGGAIAFVGLIGPHIGRRLIGPRHEYLIPVSALIGALLVLVSDMFARELFAPVEIPIGVVISVIGAPYFIYLLFKTGRPQTK